ncbi:polysaccharide deacetylase family protein [Paenibacillus donghaensis]|uniref:polysaccharide deacetylase family protein n=1 Tax=Paenibacillus donghaensis TaxID=414771 RepID=UPI0018834C8F|nr:polysaccharide deacetylase family protein [Paenibacillus donghaensis]MBE9913201.1 polysaccharide deacetylase family protein [Paenibacillus donghaensis]
MNGRKIAVLLACVAIVIGIARTGAVGEYFREAGKQPAMAVATMGSISDDPTQDPLYKQILQKREETRIQPEDAVLDRVWKAIPGYNGLEIDVEETYKQAKAAGISNPITYVYRQIPPKVKLDDLGAEPIYRGNPKKPMVALMINVAWGNEFIVPMLDVLDKEKVKATFFFDGSWLKKNPELAKEIQKRGHELENHAYTHPNMSQLSEYRASLEISKTQKLLKESLGVHNKWFAPPSGDFNRQTVQIAHSLGLKTVLWTLDTVDWKNPPPESIITKISKRVSAGTLILMHPTASSSKALQGMIQTIKEKGLIPGTVGQTLSPERIIPPNG